MRTRILEIIVSTRVPGQVRSDHHLAAGSMASAAKILGDPQVVERCPADRLAELYALRARVWNVEGANVSSLPSGGWSDAADAKRLHWVAYVDDRIVAGASLSICDSVREMDEPEVYDGLSFVSTRPIAAPCRVVVERGFRDRGFIHALLDAQDHAARMAGAALALRQASPTMRGLLEQRGWRSHGVARPDGRFPGVDFTVMSLVLDASGDR